MKIFYLLVDKKNPSTGRWIFFINFDRWTKSRRGQENEKFHFFQIPQFKTSTNSQVLTSRCSQKAPSYPPRIRRSLMVTNALTGSTLGLGLGLCAIQKENWPLGWRLIMEKMQGSLSKRSSSSTGQMVAGIGPRTLRFDLQMNCQPREWRCSLVASC